MNIPEGTRLSHYEVVSAIGAGGMGEVYLARDSRLERNVALKILPAESRQDEDRLRRFLQEARTASNLNHPNIVTIYDVGDVEMDGQRVHYIAMELVDGVTLRSLIHDGRTKPKQLLRHLAQVAEGMARAQGAGVVHRDLKPDNIMVARSGEAKILDFGLAKQTETTSFVAEEDETRRHDRTREGVVMGSVGYMSPEQVEGRSVDSRTDVFSFGCILFEAITRQKPFQGKSTLDVLHAVLHSDPQSLAELSPETPMEVRRIVKRCLAKDPDARYQSFRDLAAQLNEVIEEYETQSPLSGIAVSSIGAPPRRRATLWVAALLVVAATALATWWFKRAESSAMPNFGPITRLTSSGNIGDASISPDGKYVALELVDRGMFRVVMRQLATGSEIEVRPPSRDAAGAPRFTSDGNYLYISRFPQEAGKASYIEVVPALGGTARRVIDDVGSTPSLSPDDKQLVFRRYVATKEEQQLVIANVDGSQQKVIASILRAHVVGIPQFSPDGKHIAMPWTSTDGGYHSNVMIVSPDGTNRRDLLEKPFFSIGLVAWRPDGRGLYVNGSDKEANAQLWHVSYPDATLQRITNDTNAYYGPFLTADGKTLLLTQAEQRSRLWRVSKDGSAKPVTSENDRTVPPLFELTPEGDLLYTSTSSGPPDLWRRALSGAQQQRLTDLPGAEYNAVAARSGNIYFLSEQKGASEIWTADATGSKGRRVAVFGKDFAIVVSLDEQWLLYATASAIERLAIRDGKVERIFNGRASTPSLSRDGKTLAFILLTGPDTAVEYALAVVPSSGGSAIKTFPFEGEMDPSVRPVFTPDGKALLYGATREGATNLWLQPLAGGAPHQVTTFDEGEIGSIHFEPNGETILISRLVRAEDAVLLKTIEN